MDTPTHPTNTSSDQVVEDTIINEFSKLLTNLKNPGTIRMLMSILEGQLEETLSQRGKSDSDSNINKTPDKVIVPVTPKYRLGVKHSLIYQVDQRYLLMVLVHLLLNIFHHMWNSSGTWCLMIVWQI